MNAGPLHERNADRNPMVDLLGLERGAPLPRTTVSPGEIDPPLHFEAGGIERRLLQHALRLECSIEFLLHIIVHQRDLGAVPGCGGGRFILKLLRSRVLRRHDPRTGEHGDVRVNEESEYLALAFEPVFSFLFHQRDVEKLYRDLTLESAVVAFRKPHGAEFFFQ